MLLNRYCWMVVFLTLSICACKKHSAPMPESPAPATPVAVSADASAEATPPPPIPSGTEVVQGGKVDLVGLNKIFKSYCATLDSGKPKSLGELVAAGYLDRLPEVPKGKKLAIDYSKMEIVLEND